MAALNLLNSGPVFNQGEPRVISARKAMKIWHLSYGVIKPAIENDWIRPQAKIQDDLDDRPAYGFAVKYVDEVLKILGSERVQGARFFTTEIISRLNELNKRWKIPAIFDEQDDRKRTQKIMREKK